MKFTTTLTYATKCFWQCNSLYINFPLKFLSVFRVYVSLVTSSCLWQVTYPREARAPPPLVLGIVAIQGENFDSGGGVSSRANVAFGPTKTNSFTPDTFATLKIYLKMRFLLRFRPCAAVGEGLAALPVLPSWIQWREEWKGKERAGKGTGEGRRSEIAEAPHQPCPQSLIHGYATVYD